MKMPFFLVVIICFVTMTTNVSKVFAQSGEIIVYPNFVELNFSKTPNKFVSKVIQVENPGSETVRVRAYVKSWNLDDFGAIKFLETPDIYSLDNYIKFNPKEFDLLPGQKQGIRLTAKLPEGVDGEFRSIIFFETVISKKAALAPDKNDLSVDVNFKSRYGIAVYAYKGNISRNAVIEDLKFQKMSENNYLIAYIKNEGNIHSNIEGEMLITPKSGASEKKQFLARYTIMPSSVQKYKILLPADLPRNDIYNLKLRLTYKDKYDKEQVIEAETSLDYTNPEIFVKDTKLNSSLIPKTPKTKAKPRLLAKPGS